MQIQQSCLEVRWCRFLQEYDKGWNIVIYTARGGKSCKTLEEKEKKYRDITEKWLKKNNVKYTELFFGKMNADYYVDDKNLSIEEFIRRDLWNI